MKDKIRNHIFQKIEATPCLIKQATVANTYWFTRELILFSFLAEKIAQIMTFLTQLRMSTKMPLKRWIWAFQIDLARSYFLLKIFHSFTQCTDYSVKVENRKNHLAWHQVLQGVSFSTPWPGQAREEMDAWHAKSWAQDTTPHSHHGGWVPGSEPKKSKTRYL